MPVISGISMSIVTASGFSSAIRVSAISPFSAVPTTSMSGSSREDVADQPADDDRVVDHQHA